MRPIITRRKLITRVRGAGEIFFVKSKDFGARMHYAWPGLDDDRIRARFPRSIDLDAIAYPDGRSIVIDSIPNAPRLDQVATAIRSSDRLMRAVDAAFESLDRAIENALNERLRLPVWKAIQHVDLFHPIVIVDTPIPSTRLERHNIAGGSSWIELRSEVTYQRLERRTGRTHSQRRRLSVTRR
jgi:hypothetical protein